MYARARYVGMGTYVRALRCVSVVPGMPSLEPYAPYLPVCVHCASMSLKPSSRLYTPIALYTPYAYYVPTCVRRCIGVCMYPYTCYIPPHHIGPLHAHLSPCSPLCLLTPYLPTYTMYAHMHSMYIHIPYAHIGPPYTGTPLYRPSFLYAPSARTHLALHSCPHATR